MVDLYNSAYGNFADEAYRQVRIETYGHDLGQTSWVTTEESDEIPRLLGLTNRSNALEIGCGSGFYAVQIAEKFGCRLLGVDINEAGIRNANQLIAGKDVASRLRFDYCDVSKPLPFGDKSFDAVFSNDVLCHIPNRLEVFREVFRTLKPGGRFLFSDALIIGGIVSHTEIATRSSIGFYNFSPPGENERLLLLAGFRVLQASDTTASAAQISQRWHDARIKWKRDLVAAEGQAGFDGVQSFLANVHTLTSERRLLRFLYLAER
jgi:SAM-dependent methyltransferase